jgi:putative MATE family efflux protein
LAGRAERLARQRSRVLGEQNLYRLILALAAPLVVSASVSTLYEVVDTFWLSRLSKQALATPTVSWPYRGIMMSVSFGLASGLSALVGQYVGAGMYRRAERSVGTVLGLLLLLNTLGAAALLLGVHGYLEAMGVPPDVRPLAAVYISVLVLTLPLTALVMVFNFAVSFAGDTRTTMNVSLASTITNLVLDPVLVFWAGLGVLGAALATAASQAVAAAYAAYSFATGRHGIRLGLADLLPDRGLLGLLARVSAPVVAQRLGMTLGFVAMVGVVSGLGTAVLAAYSIGQVVLGLDRVIAMPVARATGIVVGQSLGAALRGRARRAARTGLVLLLAVVGSYIALMLAFRGEFVSLFTRDPGVAAAAERMVTIFGPSILGFNVFILANVVARASGHTLLLSALGIARLWLLRIPLSSLLAYHYGLGDTGLWAGMAASNYAVGAAAGAWLLRGDWAHAVIEKTGAQQPPAPRG